MSATASGVRRDAWGLAQLLMSSVSASGIPTLRILGTHPHLQKKLHFLCPVVRVLALHYSLCSADDIKRITSPRLCNITLDLSEHSSSVCVGPLTPNVHILEFI
ncbi:hypothetical protein DFJ58DRAFT_789437 [Suillus subalutaceus]|uniref:uncharacterized protein n=1 Tax=Suillus subalutaceus TaxID=48586 RepID=UPI001B862DAE|nr:uncharacterized protein DFJ58DRAFT_789437 [Suillus subalutaceus]KAG1853762.1 hypothetical protein DFJ58DRAFT_789437 [Suillus subalutaceus]